MGGGDGGASSWNLKKAVKRIFAAASFCNRQQTHVSPSPVSRHDSRNHSSSSLNNNLNTSSELIADSTPSSNKNLCTICLDPLDYISGSKPIFTAQCSHSFHFACITSNVTHGSLTCPICRARWTQLPRCPLHDNHRRRPVPPTPIASSRRPFWHYNDPIDPDHAAIARPRLSFSLLAHPRCDGAHLCVKLEYQPATDLVVVASPSGTYSEMLAKQAMVLVVSSLRPTDRLAIVTCPSSTSASALRACTLRRMTPCGKRTALRTIDRMCHDERPDTMGCLEKGVEILEGRVRENPRSCILHLTDIPSRPHRRFPITIHQFGFDGCNGSIVRDFEEFLARTLGGGVEDVEVRVGERKNMAVRIGELRGGEERNIPLCLGGSGRVIVKYSYRDGGCIRTGDVAVGVEEDDQWGGSDCEDRFVEDGRLSNYGGNWGKHLPIEYRV